MKNVEIEPISAVAFSPFGDLITLREVPDKLINQGLCGRHHDLATLDFGTGGRAGISLFDAQPRELPLSLDMMERHPEGSQAFIPMSENAFLVIVALDNNGSPGRPRAFLTEPGQGINFHVNTWHGVLTPLTSPGLFAVIDRIGTTPNLQEHWFTEPFIITKARP